MFRNSALDIFALTKLICDDAFAFKVSPQGSAFVGALKADRASGQYAPQAGFPVAVPLWVEPQRQWSSLVIYTITTEGLSVTSVGTVSHTTLAATNLAASMRR